jgi:hypothetical protein
LPDYHNTVNDSLTAPIAKVKAEYATEMAQRSKSDKPMSVVNPAGVLPAWGERATDTPSRIAGSGDPKIP